MRNLKRIRFYREMRFEFLTAALMRFTFWEITPCRFDVGRSVHHHMIQIIQPTRCNSFTSLLLDVYVWLSIFRASPRPSSGAYDCARSLWFYRWREVAGALLVVVWQVEPHVNVK
jgi:hypothetical protein